MHFTGADLGRLTKRKSRNYHSESEASYSDEESKVGGEDHNMQVALRDKEDMLVEKAMSRIRRAQELGKKNVKLSQEEMEALQRKQQKDAARQGQPKLKDRRRSGQNSKKPTKKENKKERRVEIPLGQYEGERRAPGMLVTTTSGQQSYAPSGYQPPMPASQKGSRFGSRNASSQSLSRRSPEQTRRGERRNSKPPSPRSPDSSSRSLPDDPNWMPRPRSSSALAGAPYYPDPNPPYQYQAYSPPLPQIPAQYGTPSRRIVSNPQTASRDRLPRYEGLANREPSPPRRRRRASPSESSSSSDDGSDAGVQVDIVSPYDGRGYDYRSMSEGTSRDAQARRR